MEEGQEKRNKADDDFNTMEIVEKEQIEKEAWKFSSREITQP